MEQPNWEIEDLNELGEPKPDFAILGYACDEGVKRNQGRVGAFDGPRMIRTKLGKVAVHFADQRIVDVGDVVCEDENMESAQALLGDWVNGLLQHDIFPIVLGGGHDIAYGHFQGIWKTMQHYPNQRLGIFNLDAHFDLRPVLETGNSGTPFNQILSQHSEIKYCVLGIQDQANTEELFKIAQQYGVQFILNHACTPGNLDKIKEALKVWVDGVDCIYISLDLDGFASAYAPGVSAPSPLGFEPLFCMEVLAFLFETGKVISFDVAELNPQYDVDQHTATLAARVIDWVVRCQLKWC